MAPLLVHNVLQQAGEPLPARTRNEFEPMLGQDFADVRLHIGTQAADSADAVSASAYTVGRHIVFAENRFDPWSAPGRQLLLHELVHAAGHPAEAPTPSGDLRISNPSDTAERHAEAVVAGAPATAHALSASPRPHPVGLHRAPAPYATLTGIKLSDDRVTVPAAAGLSLVATRIPAGAPDTTLSVGGDSAKVAVGTTIDQATGAITVAADQTGGSAHISADQAAPSGATSSVSAPLNFIAIPSGITGTTSSAAGSSRAYGGAFTHTFGAPAPGVTAIESARVNEQFAAATGTTLTLAAPFGTLSITINAPNSPTAGWPLDASGTMTAPDNVTWSNAMDARPFVANASNVSTSATLPQEVTATQNFRNLIYPARVFDPSAVASTTHRRAFELRGGSVKAVTSANAAGINEEIVDDYSGPTIFTNCQISPATLQVAPPAPAKRPAAPAPAVVTGSVTVDQQGKTATPTFSIQGPDLGCKMSRDGTLTPGTTAGTITVRAGDSRNYDETTVALVPIPTAPAPAVPGSPTP